MPRLIHIARQSEAAKIRRNGIRARRLSDWIDGYDRFIWVFPVLESYTLTHQWMRELKRLGTTTLAAITIRIPDDEPVFVRHYASAPGAATAADAVRIIRAADDQRGYEIIIPRRIGPKEIETVRVLPRAIGWRYHPGAKNQPMKTCDCPYCMPRGEVKAARYRARVTDAMRRQGIARANASYLSNDGDIEAQS